MGWAIKLREREIRPLIMRPWTSQSITGTEYQVRYSLVEGVVRHFRVCIKHVAEAAVIPREEHHQAEFDHESWHRDDRQDILLRPMSRQIVDVDLERVEDTILIPGISG